MLSRNSAQAICCCALLALCALSSACSGGQKGMTQQKVSAFLAEWDAAQQSHNLEAVAARLSPKFQYEMTVKGFGPTETERGDYDRYIKDTKSGFDSSQSLNSKREMTVIAVDPGGQSASVLYEIHDAMNIEGRFYRTLSSGTMTIELEDDRMVITSMKFVASPASDRRHSFQPNIPSAPKL